MGGPHWPGAQFQGGCQFPHVIIACCPVNHLQQRRNNTIHADLACQDQSTNSHGLPRGSCALRWMQLLFLPPSVRMRGACSRSTRPTSDSCDSHSERMGCYPPIPLWRRWLCELLPSVETTAVTGSRCHTGQPDGRRGADRLGHTHGRPSCWPSRCLLSVTRSMAHVGIRLCRVASSTDPGCELHTRLDMAGRVLSMLRQRNMVHSVTSEAIDGIQATWAKSPLSARHPEPGAYIGFDPTAASLHLGSMVQLNTLWHLRRAGYAPIALVSTIAVRYRFRCCRSATE